MKSATNGAVIKRQLSQQTQQQGFIALVKSDILLDLIKDPLAFCSLTIFAYRARYHNHSTDGLMLGESLTGRKKLGEMLGVEEGRARGAMVRLKRAGLIECKGTNEGTVVTLVNDAVYDIGISYINQPVARAKPSVSQQVTINRDRKNKKERTYPSNDLDSSDVVEALSEQYPDINIPREIELVFKKYPCATTQMFVEKWLPHCEKRRSVSRHRDSRENEFTTIVHAKDPEGWREWFKEEFPNVDLPKWSDLAIDHRQAFAKTKLRLD